MNIMRLILACLLVIFAILSFIGGLAEKQEKIRITYVIASAAFCAFLYGIIKF